MKTLRGFALVAGIALAGVPAWGQSTPMEAAPGQSAAAVIPPDQQATKEQIQKLFEVLRLRKQTETMMNLIPKLIEQSFHTDIRDMNQRLPPGKGLMSPHQAALEKVMNKYMEQATHIYSLDEMIADAIPVYQRHISKSDADAVIAFYSSPPGQRLLDEQPVITSEYMPIVMSRIQTRTRRLADEMQAEIQQIVKPEPAGKGAYVPRTD